MLWSSVTAEHEGGVVGGNAVVCGVIHPYEKWYISHVTFIKQSVSISIHVSSSLDPYTTYVALYLWGVVRFWWGEYVSGVITQDEFESTPSHPTRLMLGDFS